jgi:hypothetical protein
VRTPRKRSLRREGRDEVDPLDGRAARAAALDILSRRDYSSGELRGKLLGKGYDVTVIAELIERLRAEKLLDDARYLENFVAYHASRGQGPNRVGADLRRSACRARRSKRRSRLIRTGSLNLSGRAKRSLELRCRPITLIGSARLDSWLTGASAARRFEPLWG